MFSKALYCIHVKSGLVWEGVNRANAFTFDWVKILSFGEDLYPLKFKDKTDNDLTHSHTMTPFDAPGKQAF